MSELSPSAQTVLDAALPVYDDEHLYVAPMEKHAGMIAAAALSAAAMTVLEEHLNCRGPLRNLDGGMHQFASRLLTIASELESQ